MRVGIAAILPVLGLSSCIALVNTGGKLDAWGRKDAVPMRAQAEDTPYYRVGAHYYMRVPVQYVELGSHWLSSSDSPAAPRRMRLGVRPDNHRDYIYCLLSESEVRTRLGVEVPPPADGTPPVLTEKAFSKLCSEPLETKMESINHAPWSVASDSLSWVTLEFLPDAPTQRSLGNKLRRPLAAVLSYWVDIPVSLAATAGAMTAELVMFPIGLVRYFIGQDDASSPAD